MSTVGTRRGPKKTPLLEQYLRLKAQHPDAILFFRLGDFYEMFFEDAEVASRLLGLTLTSRNRNDPDPIPLAGVPWHQRDTYVARLLRRGHKVAICEQLQDASEAKGLVDRGVTEILTPGSLLTESLLEAGESVFLAAIALPTADSGDAGGAIGFAAGDASTGELRCGEASLEGALGELSRLRVAEWLVPEGVELPLALHSLVAGSGTQTRLSPADFPRDASALEERFGRGALSTELRASQVAGAAVAAVVHYLDRVQGGRAAQLRPPVWLRPGEALHLGPEAQASLELFASGTGEESHTLWALLRRTRTGAGARRLRHWLERPLLEVAAIQRRQAAVAHLVERGEQRQALRGILADTYDLERLTARVRAERASPRDVVALRDTLSRLPALREALGASVPPLLETVGEQLDPHSELHAYLARALVDDPPHVTHEGGLLRPGFDAECDRLRAAARSGKEWMAAFETSERERTGISSLKLGYNRVFGYYVEVTKSHLARVPEDYERKQTLTGAERYVTPELKRMEGEVLGAEEKLKHAEQERFLVVRGEVARSTESLGRAADGLAALDALAALAEVAVREGYVRPQVDASDRILLRGARHPVVERHLGTGRFVPNDVEVDGTQRQILLLTCPPC